MDHLTWTTHESPLGPLTLVASPRGLRALSYDDDAPRPPAARRPPPALARAAAQLDEYFAGARTAFDLDLDLHGSPLQVRVWGELRRIPFGRTVTYRELAEAVGRPDIVRGVAGAVARTPVPIVVPCHRVIGSDGSLRGYVGGLERKASLLAHEGPADAPRSAGVRTSGQLELL